MHHVFGLVASMLASVHKGSTVVMVPGTGLSITSFIAAIERERGTMFLGVPYIFALAVDIAENEGIKNDLSSLRLCSSSGAPLSTDIMRRFKRQYGYDIIDCWGMTEAVCHVTCQPANGTGKPGSVGRPLSGWEVRVVDNNGNELPPNHTGELVIRGPIMKEYYHNTPATSEAIKNGWLFSGDIGVADEDGFVYVTGRKKDMIIVKGQNIYTSDIESVLQTHPKVAEAAVLGIPDDMRGEIVGAVVSLKAGEKATEQELRGFCVKHLINYKVPKKIILIDSLPKNADGKIDKEGIRARLSIPSIFQKKTIS
jgi:long-chain acyl-CoA synthetase